MPTTSPDGFFYPDDSSDSDLAQHLASLAANVQTKFTAQETWTSWTPTFNTPTDGGISAGGSGGHASGFYRRSSSGSGAFVYAEFRFLLGTAPTIVQGAFTLILPVLAYTWGGACINQTIGSWTLRDNSTSPVGHVGGALGVYNATTGDLAHLAGGPGDNGLDDMSRFRMDSNDPITFAVGDNLTGQLFYRAA